MTPPPADITHRLRCPVCEIVYFRIGVRVWPTGLLKVCSRRCRYKIKREVVAARQRSDNAHDREQARRRISWHYIEKGGQGTIAVARKVAATTTVR